MLTFPLTAWIFCLSIISEIPGIGVAFAPIPITGTHSHDLVQEVQPIALFLNGTTALFASAAFKSQRYVSRC